MANLLTVFRMILILPFTACFFVDSSWGMSAALGIFLVAAATDFLDGWVARARSETSALGAALDPIADKLLVATGLLLLTRNGVIEGAMVAGALAMLLREILVGGLRESLAAQGESLPVIALAKWKTATQLSAIALLLAAAPGGPFPEGAAAAVGVFWAATLLTIWTGAGYIAGATRTLRAPKGRHY